MNKNNETWEQASAWINLHGKDLIKLASERDEFWGYKLNLYENVLTIIKDSTSQIKFTEPGESILKEEKHPELAVISLFDNGSQYEVREGRIVKEQTKGAYPKMRYGWRKDPIHGSESNLIFAGANLNSCTFVIYHMNGGYEKVVYTEDECTLHDFDLPDSIDCRTHLLGERIPWQVPAQAMESMIIESSGLKSVLTKLENYLNK